MKKIITTDREIDLKGKIGIYPDDLPNNIQNIKITHGGEYIDLQSLNLNIIKFELDNGGPGNVMRNCDINKLVLNTNRHGVAIFNSNIQDIYIQSEINLLRLFNTPLPNLHGRVDLINKIKIEQ